MKCDLNTLNSTSIPPATNGSWSSSIATCLASAVDVLSSHAIMKED